MRLMLLFPKPEFYLLKSTEEKRVLRNQFKQWIDSLIEGNAELAYFAEDELACILMQEFNVNAECVMVTSETDLSFIKRYYELLGDNLRRLSSLSDKCAHEKFPKLAKFKIPSIQMYKDKDKWLEDRITYLENCNKFNINRYLNEQTGLLMFRGGGSTNVYASRLNDVREGDGKLYIEVSANGSYVAYYGGVYVDKEVVKTIVGCEV